MKLNILKEIPLEFSRDEVVKFCRIEKLQNRVVKLDVLIEEGASLVEPKAVYKILRIVEIEGDSIVLEDGEIFRSRLLAEKLRCASELMPYIVTIGSKLERRVSQLARENMLNAFILDNIGTYALRLSSDYLRKLVEDERGYKVSKFSPGLTDPEYWSIMQQKILFNILMSDNRVRKDILVTLTEKCLMIPRKSVSGVMGQTEKEFIECQICRRRCDYRRSPYVKPLDPKHHLE